MQHSLGTSALVPVQGIFICLSEERTINERKARRVKTIDEIEARRVKTTKKILTRQAKKVFDLTSNEVRRQIWIRVLVN
jgi:hypothetical protein